MSTGYSWEGIRQVRATLLGARHVPERLCGGRVYLVRVLDLYLCSTFLNIILFLILLFLARLCRSASRQLFSAHVKLSYRIVN